MESGLGKASLCQAELTHRYRFLTLSTSSVATGPVGPQKSSSVPRISMGLSPGELGEDGYKLLSSTSYNSHSCRRGQVVDTLCSLPSPEM